MDIGDGSPTSEMDGDSFARWRSYLDAIPQHIAILDADGAIVECNASWQRFGCENGIAADFDWRGISYLNICRSTSGPETDDATRAFDGIGRILAGEAESFRLEYPCHDPTTSRWFLMEVKPLGNGQAGAIISHLDITDRVLTEQRAHLLSHVMDGSSEALMITDADERIIYVNPAFTAITGYAAEEVLDKTPRLLSSGKHDRDFLCRDVAGIGKPRILARPDLEST